MFTASETPVITLILLVALGILSWGFFRAKPFGKLGILAWLQSVVLMAPWLLFFGLFAAGIYINLAAILLMLVISSGLYIFLGRQLRAAGQDAILKEKAAKMQSNQDLSQSSAANSPETPESDNGKGKPELLGIKETLPIPENDLKVIKGIFGIDSFFVTETIPYQEGAIFKGNLRGEAEATHNKLSAALQERLGDRYRLFMIENPEGKPTIVVLPSTNDPKISTLSQKLLAIVLLVATIATSLETAGFFLGFDFYNNLNRIQEVLPIAAGIMAILFAHEIGHFIMAKRHNIRLSLPYFIPAWQLGSFGAITRFESILPNRKVMFDVALAGPATGGLVSLLMLIVGLTLSHEGSFFQVPAEFFQGSILVGTLAKVVLGSALQKPLVDVHPLTIIGWLGLVITALNTMPAGQLDGGRIVHAIYGRKIASRVTLATFIFLAIAAFANPIAIYWAIIILFLQRDLERPSLNEISEPDDARAALGLLALFLMITTLIPLTPGIAGRLGIGGANNLF
ncbi:site-2 protease family protein [[Phormidium ambiguum] IAM M-71]|uniref:Site-2 protease family protein n=1 Tax=[Phormidium ambiguum] IAM M-71 TaxID=454136 RepID=A0A1U7IH15_9CYAN|nr:site-2 protease family protein [Phormidium ambiguum]OKH36393.1 site-2 protease family protein [Phormidium ambiguum IAM M-71]